MTQVVALCQAVARIVITTAVVRTMMMTMMKAVHRRHLVMSCPTMTMIRGRRGVVMTRRRRHLARAVAAMMTMMSKAVCLMTMMTPGHSGVVIHRHHHPRHPLRHPLHPLRHRRRHRRRRLPLLRALLRPQAPLGQSMTMMTTTSSRRLQAATRRRHRHRRRRVMTPPLGLLGVTN